MARNYLLKSGIIAMSFGTALLTPKSTCGKFSWSSFGKDEDRTKKSREARKTLVTYNNLNNKKTLFFQTKYRFSKGTVKTFQKCNFFSPTFDFKHPFDSCLTCH